MYQARLFNVARFRLIVNRDQLLLLFTSGNLAFLAVDVAIAHSVNAFRPVYEWIPVLLPPMGAVTALGLAVQRGPSRLLRGMHLLTMLVSVLVGLLGLAFHLRAMLNPLGGVSWSWLVFSAPVLAPLSFAGVGLIGIFAACEEEGPGVLTFPGLVRLHAPISKTQHLLWFLGLGFAGAAATSFLDHGQYGYTMYEWTPVVAGCFATFVVLGRAVTNDENAIDDWTYFWTMILCLAVGVVGFAFHLSHDVAGTGAISLERMRSYAPVFAPLLFADLSILGLLVMIVETDEQA